MSFNPDFRPTRPMAPPPRTGALQRPGLCPARARVQAPAGDSAMHGQGGPRARRSPGGGLAAGGKAMPL